jgi:hypothetical protein
MELGAETRDLIKGKGSSFAYEAQAIIKSSLLL